MFLKKLFNFIPRDEFSKALDCFNNGEYEKALERFNRLLQEEGGKADADLATIELYACESHVGLSNMHKQKGELREAIEEMEKAVALKPGYADLRCNLGLLYYQANEKEKASESLRKSLEINPKFFKARIFLAKVLLSCNENERALELLSEAAKSCPNFHREKFGELLQAARTRGLDETTEVLFHEIMEEKPSPAQLSRELAIEAIQNGNNTEAIRELKKALSFNPDYPDLHNYLGIAYGNSGMIDDSIEEFETALKINPYYLKARLNLALAFYETGEFGKAHAHLKKVLEVQPGNQLANNLLAELEAVEGR
jgi:tetratricopeptide (TPR) repeat protein